MRKIKIQPGEVQLWWASLDVSDSEIDQLQRLLAPDELRRAERFRIAAARRRFVAARAGLRLVLGRATNIGPADLVFRFGEHGKPRLADGGPHFNASDSGDYVVVALTTAEVGVDIELVRTLGRRDRLARRICTDRELDVLERVPDHDRVASLLRLWTCKEAALKAVGIGLSGGVRNIEVEIPTNGSPLLSRLIDEADHWTLLFPDLLPNVLCSVVVKGRDWRAVGRPFSLQSI